MATRPLILYHGPNCLDGWTACWAALLRLGEHVQALPVSYNQPPPKEALEAGIGERDLFILDFSYPRDVLMRLADRNKVVVLDHHDTARKDLEGFSYPNLQIVFDLEKSGAMLAWEYFHPLQELSWLVHYAQDRDLWRWKLPNSRALSAYLHSIPWTFEVWTRLHQEWAGQQYHEQNDWGDFPAWRDYVKEGEAILRYQEKVIQLHVAQAREIELDGHKVLSVNATTLVSEITGRLAQGRPFGVSWHNRSDGKRVFSLRSDQAGLHVGEIAKRFGGGGHPRAAGFEVDYGEPS